MANLMQGTSLIHTINNRATLARGRKFPGMDAPHPAQTHVLQQREAVLISLKADDLLALRWQVDQHPIRLVAFDGSGHDALPTLSLAASSDLAFSEFRSHALTGWMSSRGKPTKSHIPCAVLAPQNGEAILKASADCDLWLVRDVSAADLVTGASVGQVIVEHKGGSQTTLPLLPTPFGDIRDEFTVKRGSAMAYELEPGEILQIIDVEGQQCSDFMAFKSDSLDAGHEQMIDSTATRSMVRRSFPGPGLFDKFYDSEMNPLLNLVQDTCGRHDTFGLACTSRGYEERGFPGHVNCSDNISQVMASYGVARRSAWPAINFFWNTWVDPSNHHIMTEESWSRPGDYVALRAMDRLVCVSTACPDDIDPINGWNPTDIHVRIYKPETPLRRAVAYREKEDAPMSLSQESAFHPKTSKLTQQFAPARDLWAPVSYPSVGTLGEYWACREAVTLQDMSGLRKYDIIGPDAERLLQEATTRNVAKLAVWRGQYTLMCDDQGQVIDDGTLFRLSPNLFRWCCGSEESGRNLNELAEANNWQARVVALGGAMPNLALQGPKSRDVLRKIAFTQPHVPTLDDLKWFGVTVARIGDRDGIPFMLSRSGYTGELGYELFCSATDAPALWDAVMDAGEEFGIAPMGSAALETIRIEAGLAAANAEFAPGVDALEAGLGFAVDFRKEQFRGREALARNAKDPRRVLTGLIFDQDDVPAHGAHVYLGERPVGVITSATRSPSLEVAIAMARLSVEHSEPGTKLEVGQMDGHMKKLSATVTNVPFIDPTRARARA